MSLRAFHIVFIVAAICLSFVMGGWLLTLKEPVANRPWLLASSFGAGILLAAYLVWFIRKSGSSKQG